MLYLPAWRTSKRRDVMRRISSVGGGPDQGTNAKGPCLILLLGIGGASVDCQRLHPCFNPELMGSLSCTVIIVGYRYNVCIFGSFCEAGAPTITEQLLGTN